MNIRTLIYTLVLITALGCSKTEESAQPQKAEPPADTSSIVTSPVDKREYRLLTLDNSLEVMLVSDPETKKSAASLSVGVGLLHDPLEQMGMAHYLEHMLFLGTEQYPDSNEYHEFMSANGGMHNAYTWLDITNYMFKVDNKAFDEALSRFSSFFKTPLFDAEFSDKERNAVNAEWSMRREMDFFGIYRLDRSMLGEHPANRFLIGNLETLGDKPNSKLVEEMKAFYHRYYSANNMKAVLISDLSIAEMKKLAKKHFSSIENKNIEIPRVTDAIDVAKVGKRKVRYIPNKDLKSLKIEYLIEDNSDQYKKKPNYFMSYLIGSEMPGSAANILKKAGLIVSLRASSNPKAYGNYGNFTIDVSLTDQGLANTDAVISTILQYIELVKEKGIDKKYFNEIKTSLNNTFLFLEKQDAFSYASALADALLNYEAELAIAAPYIFEEFDENVVRSVAKQLNPNTMRVWLIHKNQEASKEIQFYSGKYEIENISDKEIDTWLTSKPSGELKLPRVNNLFPTEFTLKSFKDNQPGKPSVVFEKDGIEGSLVNSEFFTEQPKGNLKVHINSPLMQESPKNQSLNSIWKTILALKNSELSDEAAIAGMYLSFEGEHGLTVTVSGFTDKQPVLLTRAFESILDEISNDEFERVKELYLRNLKNSLKSMGINQLFPTYNNVIYTHRISTEQLIREASNLTLDDLNSFKKSLLQNNNIRILAFGNYDESVFDWVIPKVKDLFTENRTVTEYVKSEAVELSTGKKYNYQIDVPIEDVSIINALFHKEPSYRSNALSRLLAEHSGTHAFNTLRTNEQLGYAVGTTFIFKEEHSGLAFYIQTPVKHANEMQERFNAYKKEYSEALSELTEEEFNSIKSGVLTTLKKNPENLNEEQSRFLDQWFKRGDYDKRTKVIAEIEKATVKDVKAFYEELMDDSNIAELLIQLRGTKYADKPFFNYEKQVMIEDLREFHKATPKS